MSTPYYTVVVSGESFRLTRKQLLSEPDNLFEKMAEAHQGGDQIEIENEPLLFKLIQGHLRGHDILPIPDGYIAYMTKEGVLNNLLKVAEEYKLHILAGKIKAFQAIQTKPQSQGLKAQYLLKKMGTSSDTAWFQDLGKQEYLAMFSGFTARSGEAQALISGRVDALAMEGYTISMSWDDWTYVYALLVLN